MHSIDMVISHIHTVLAIERDKPTPKCRVYMMLIGNYGGHMAFTTDPPYCVAYAAEYKHTNDNPSKMTFCEPSNHGFTMTASNMVVCRGYWSVANWDPVEKKLTTGGCLLIPRGMQFGAWVCFQDLVMPCVTMWSLDRFIHVAGGTISDGGTFPNHGSNLPRSSGGFGTFYCGQEVAKLKKLGVLNPSQHAWVPTTLSASNGVFQSG